MILSWQTDINSKLKKDWKKLQDEILHSKDKLKENYIALNPNDFVDFTLVVSENHEIEAFAAVQEKKIWNGFKRIATRLYIRPKFRKTVQEGSALDQYTRKTSYTALLINYQYQKFKNDPIFISRECTYKSFERFIKIFDLHNKFQVMDGRYQVCGIDSKNPKCIQKICVSNNSLKHINKISQLRYD